MGDQYEEKYTHYADDGTRMKRYFPEKAWDLLSDEEERKAAMKCLCDAED